MKTNYSRSFIMCDKENHAEVSNSNVEDAYKYKIPRKSLMTQKSLPQDPDCHYAFKDSTNMIQPSLAHSKTEENLREKEVQRKVNADKVKRNLNEGQAQNMNHYMQEKPQPVLRKSYSNNVPNQQQYNSQQLEQVQMLKEASTNYSTAPNTEPSIKEFITIDDKQQITKQQYKEMDNKNLLKFYSSQILAYMKYKEAETTPVNCLAKHNIPVNLRAKMVDWMIEVLSSYKCTEQTFFLSVRLLDLYFQRTKKVHEISELHLVGVTSMFIACKYEEIYPMKLQVVYDKIAHKKLPVEQIKEKEAEILETINFELIGATPYEITMHTLYKTGLKDFFEPYIYSYLEKICVYLSKMILYDYELIQNRQYCLLSGALIFVAFKIIEQIESNFKAEEKVKVIIKILNLQHQTLIDTAAKILTLAKSFDKLYPQLENLKKFNGFSLDEHEKKQQ